MVVISTHALVQRAAECAAAGRELEDGMKEKIGTAMAIWAAALMMLAVSACCVLPVLLAVRQ